MKYKVISKIICAVLWLMGSSAMASTNWYVNGVSGNDSNDCQSPTTACKTIAHAISLASSGDSIMVAPATYIERLTIGISLNVLGSGAGKTIIDGGLRGTVVTISKRTQVTLSQVTIRNGYALFGGGIGNEGTLTINQCILRRNRAYWDEIGGDGGGISNGGALTINQSTLRGNSAQRGGGGISNGGTLTINNSTLSVNSAGDGGGILNGGTLTINNSTLSGNSGGAVYNDGTLKIDNGTLGGNSGSGIDNHNLGSATLQNSIVANNTGGNCGGTITSNGYNLSSDGTCAFNSAGDLNNTDPQLGLLQHNGGPTQTMALSSGSPAIDAGNPSGCTDGNGHLLTTDQRGKPRPDKEDTGGCDMGAYESQSD